MNKIERILLTAAAVIFVVASFVFARDNFLKEANIDYSADEVIVSGGKTLRSKVFYSPGKIRKDQVVEGMQQIMIIRQDKDAVWILMPREHVYMEMPIAKGKGIRDGVTGDFAKDMVIQETLGEEVVNGVKATKSKVTVKDPDGKFEGLMWQSKNGIIVKMQTDRMTLELKNLRQETQDPKVFEIPLGYTKMDVPGMGMWGNIGK